MNLSDLRQACDRPLPHPDLPGMADLAGPIVQRVLEHFDQLPSQHLGKTASRAKMETLLRRPVPEEGRDLATVLAEFDERIAPYACRVNHPRFLAFVPGAPTIVSVLGDWLTAGFDFFAGVWYEAAGPAMVELVVLDWLRTVLGLPGQTEGILTSGGSEANLLALVVARDRLAFEDRSRAVLYVARSRHWSVDRAARILGFSETQIRRIDGPEERLAPSALAAQVALDRAAGVIPWAVVATAGATNTGRIDPLAGIADVCAAERLWLHVDAAYGWAAALVPEGKRLLAGIERADSVTLDPHKWLAQTFEVGCLLVREGSLLTRTFALRPEYMEDVEPATDEVNFADRGLALTRRFRALKVWLSLQLLGAGWFRRLIEHGMALARYAEELLRQRGFEVVVPAESSIVCFRQVPGGGQLAAEIDRHNRELLDALRATGKAFLSSTRVAGCVVLRFCFVNWRTTAEDVDAVVELLGQLGKEMADRG